MLGYLRLPQGGREFEQKKTQRLTGPGLQSGSSDSLQGAASAQLFCLLWGPFPSLFSVTLRGHLTFAPLSWVVLSDQLRVERSSRGLLTKVGCKLFGDQRCELSAPPGLLCNVERRTTFLIAISLIPHFQRLLARTSRKRDSSSTLVFFL